MTTAIRRFRTQGMSESDARRAYLDRLDGILDTEFLAPFAAEMDAYRLGPFSALCLTATPRRSTRRADRIAHDRYDAIGVQYIVSGNATGEAEGREIVSVPGTVMVLDYARPFTVMDLEPRVVVNIAVPRTMLQSRIPDLTGLHACSPNGPAATILAGFMDQLWRTLPDLPEPASAPLGRAFVELLAAAMSGEETPVAAADRDALTIRRAERLVIDRIGLSDLDPAWLAARLGLSRSDLYAVMEPYGGVARFILHQRLRGARSALEDPADHRRIGAIAYAYGFSSEAHFARVFRAAFGTTASAVRHARRSKGS